MTRAHVEMYRIQAPAPGDRPCLIFLPRRDGRLSLGPQTTRIRTQESRPAAADYYLLPLNHGGSVRTKTYQYFLHCQQFSEISQAFCPISQDPKLFPHFPRSWEISQAMVTLSGSAPLSPPRPARPLPQPAGRTRLSSSTLIVMCQGR